MIINPALPLTSGGGFFFIIVITSHQVSTARHNRLARQNITVHCGPSMRRRTGVSKVITMAPIKVSVKPLLWSDVTAVAVKLCCSLQNTFQMALNLKRWDMTRRIFIYGVILLTIVASPAFSADQWYKCRVKASSHTGYYTFKISTSPCAVYWLELDKHLKIKSCKLPEIAALKPSARDDLSIVWFNIKTGQFYDYLSGVYDRGVCVAGEKP